MCDNPDDSASSGAPKSSRAVVLARLRELADERSGLETRQQAITKEMHALLRKAHDLGSSWEEIAATAGYSSAASARNQALSAQSPPQDRVDPSSRASYTVAEASQLLGVSQKTVYQWIQSGRVAVAVDRVRGRRIYLPDSTSLSD